MINRFLCTTAAAAALLIGVSAIAEAAPFGVRKGVGGVGAANIFVADLYQDVDITIDFGLPHGVHSFPGFGAGVFNLEVSSNPLDANPAWQTLRTFCIEITQFITFPDPNIYEDATIDVAVGTANARDEQIRRLWEARAADAYSVSSLEFDGVAGATAGDRAAAFQVALWEIEADGGTDLDSGVFKLDSGGVVRALALQYLSIAQDPLRPLSGSLFALVSEENQDLLIARTGPGTPGGAGDPVPAPATLALFGAALVGLGTLRARRKA